MELLELLKDKFSSDIKRYGITSVTKQNNEVIVKSEYQISWDLFESIKLELINY